MPQLDALSWTLWGLTIGVQFALAAVLVVRGCHREWIAVCIFCWFNGLSSLVLLAAIFNVFGYDNAPGIYFYGFWTKQVLNAFLQIWIVVELGCNLAPAITKVLRRLVPALACVYLAGALFLVSSSPLNFPLFETRVAVSIHRATSLGWLGLFVCLTYAADALGVKWSKRNMGVAIGFTLLSIAETGTSWLLGEFPSWYWISNLRAVAWQCAMAVWIITFLRFDSDGTDPNPQEVLSALDTLKTILQSLRPK